MVVITVQVCLSLLCASFVPDTALLCSGPKRYDYVPSKDDWKYSRDGQTMGDLLNDELGRALGLRVDLGIRDITRRLS